MDVEEARAFVRANHRAVLATLAQDGTPQLSPVAVGIGEAGDLLISTRETAVKAKNIRREPHVWVCVLNDGFYGQFVQISGPVTVVALPDAMDGLIEYYRSVSGEHPDWDDYRTAMERERRILLRVEIVKAGPTFHG
ncbi:MAG: PPOX class F420-dependent oxidoreductase [Frankiaceae bacterium]|nr:PPOX class F420-dependent oxidoreductase [Frankiaceae bacterium]MBV9872386.1 PPOX class F420-dependent oxidoreductase [Frankiaceae bacterium]